MTTRSSKVAAVLLDRDGTINVDNGYVHRVAQWRWCPGAIEAIGRLRDAGFRLAVVTNQSGIAKGLYTGGDVDAIHAYLARELEASGTAIDAFAFCPHDGDTGCDCRKPATGMAATIQSQLDAQIDAPRSWMVGDKPSDILFGNAIGVRTAMIRSRYWCDDDLTCRPDVVVDSLLEATHEILATRGEGSGSSGG